MPLREPKVLILTPAHNGEKWLRKTAASVFAQTHENFTYVISDDGSTDASNDIASELALSDAPLEFEDQFYKVAEVLKNDPSAPIPDWTYSGLRSPDAEWTTMRGPSPPFAIE